MTNFPCYFKYLKLNVKRRNLIYKTEFKFFNKKKIKTK